MRAVILAGFVLLAAWAVALVLGVMGGFGSLPLLPSAHAHGSSDSGSTPAHNQVVAPRPATQAGAVRAQRTGAAVQTNSVGTSGGRSVAVKPHVTPLPAPPHKVTGSQGSGVTVVSTSSGHGYGTTRTTPGKPAGTPGVASGGSGAPGRLR